MVTPRVKATRISSLRSLGLAMLMAGGIGCGSQSPTATQPSALVAVHALTPATIRELAVEISGPGIDQSVVANLPVGSDSIASGTIEVTAGMGRRIIITAVDTSGTPTHRGDTTLTLIPGPNPPLAMTLRPLSASLGITVTFGNARSPAHLPHRGMLP